MPVAIDIYSNTLDLGWNSTFPETVAEHSFYCSLSSLEVRPSDRLDRSFSVVGFPLLLTLARNIVAKKPIAHVRTTFTK